MSKYIPGNQKHLTLEDCIYIKNSLNIGLTIKDIARYLYKDPATIFKEIRAHRLPDWYHKAPFHNVKNFFIHRYHCRKTNAYGKIIVCGVKYASCPTCNQTCSDFLITFQYSQTLYFIARFSLRSVSHMHSPTDFIFSAAGRRPINKIRDSSPFIQA